MTCASNSKSSTGFQQQRRTCKLTCSTQARSTQRRRTSKSCRLAEVAHAVQALRRNGADDRLHCSINSFRFLCFLIWFVLGPGGLWGPLRPREGPRRGLGGPPGCLRTPPGPGQKTFKNLYLLQGPIKRQTRCSGTLPHLPSGTTELTSTKLADTRKTILKIH